MKKENSCRGFTLIEVLVTLTLLGLVLGTFCQIFLSQAEADKTQSRILQGQQGLRIALEIIAEISRARDILLKINPFWEILRPGSPVPLSPKLHKW